MEQLLIEIVIFCVFVGIIWILLQWFGVPISQPIINIFWLLIGGIVIVLLIRFLWPVLTGGSLNLGKIGEVRSLIGLA